MVTGSSIAIRLEDVDAAQACEKTSPRQTDTAAKRVNCIEIFTPKLDSDRIQGRSSAHGMGGEYTIGPSWDMLNASYLNDLRDPSQMLAEADGAVTMAGVRIPCLVE